MFAAIIALALLATILHALLQTLERRALVWWRGR
jgi:ABC-type nitrate/sulfonate/bicarbonate transport system permease component